MQFIIPYIKVLSTTTSGNHPQETVKEVMEQEDDEEENAPMSCHLPACSPISNQSLSPTPCLSSRPTASNTDIRSNRRKGKPLPTVDDGIMDYFKARKAKLETKTEDKEDPKRMFLLSLLPDIKAMSDSQTRTFKRRVLALVDEILEESPSS